MSRIIESTPSQGRLDYDFQLKEVQGRFDYGADPTLYYCVNAAASALTRSDTAAHRR